MSQDKEKEIDFFDQFIEDKKEYVGLSSKSYDKLFNELSKFLTVKDQQMHVIDLGCGTGTFTKKLSLLNGEIYGCDISSKSIAQAVKLNSKVKFSVQDIENLSFESNKFDVVVLSGVLHHFNNLEKILIESKRILKHDGLLFAFDPNLCNPFFWLYRRKKSWFYSKEGVTKNEEPLTKNKIQFALDFCKFQDIKIYGVSNMSYKYIANKELSFLLPIYNLIDYFLNIIPYFRNIYGSFLITKAKK